MARSLFVRCLRSLVTAFLLSKKPEHRAPSPNCAVCAQPCPPGAYRYCSRPCFLQAQARRAKAKRHGTAEALECVVCRKPVTGKRRTVTCSDKCAVVRDREVRRVRNALYHRTVRKVPGSGVQTNADWREPRKSQLASRAADRRRADPAKAKAIAKRDREKHRDRRQEATRQWKTQNPEKVKEHRKRDYERHPDRFHRHALVRKLQKFVGGDHKLAMQLLHMINEAVDQPCPYCGGPITPDKGSRHVDHIVPLAKGGKHRFTNLVIVCRACNLEKLDQDPVLWLKSKGFVQRFSARFPDAWSRLQRWKAGDDLEIFSPPPIVDAVDACRLAGISRKTLGRRIDNGIISPLPRKGTQHLRFSVTELARQLGRTIFWNPKAQQYESLDA